MSDIGLSLQSGLMPFGYGSHETVDESPGLYSFWARCTCLYVGMSENLRRRIKEHETAEANAELAKYFADFEDEIEFSVAYADETSAVLRKLELEAVTMLQPLTNRQGAGSQ